MTTKQNLVLLVASTMAVLLIVVVAIRHSTKAPHSEAPQPPGLATIRETWSCRTGAGSTHDVWHTPAVGADGTIYVPGDRDLVALKPSGALKWRYAKPAAVLPPVSVLIADDGTIWSGSPYGWTERINSDGYGSLQVGGMGDTYHMALSHKGVLLASGRLLSIPVDTTGYPKLRIEVIPNNLGPLRSAAFSSNAVIAIDGRGDLISWALDFQQINWREKVGYGCHHPALARSGTMYVACPKELVAINPDGSGKWSFPTNSLVSPAAIGEDGSIFFGSADGNVYSLDPEGRLRWKFEVGKAVSSTPAISSSGVIYFGSQDGNLYALDAAGKPLWAMKTNAEVYSPTISPDGTVYVQSSDGVLHAIAQPQNGGLAGQWPKLDADLSNTARMP